MEQILIQGSIIPVIQKEHNLIVRGGIAMIVLSADSMF